MAKNKNFYQEKSEDILDYFQTSLESGLKSEQIPKLREEYGLNNLILEKPKTWLNYFLEQFNSFLIWLLLAAAVFSLFIDHLLDAMIIFLVILINALIGSAQAFKADQILQKLKEIASQKSSVIRDNKQVEIDSSELLPGDILLLAEGDKAGADARVLKSNNLKINQSQLTGESEALVKTEKAINQELVYSDQTNMVWSSSLVVGGNATAVVTAIGESSLIGQIQNSLKQTDSVNSHFQAEIKNLTQKIAIFSFFLSASIFIIEFLGKQSSLADSVLLTTMVLVSSIPDGLPAILTVILAIGAKEMSKHNTLVRSLSSIETAGAITAICSDKTGTITENRMQAKEIFLVEDLVQNKFELNKSVTISGKKIDEGGFYYQNQLQKNYPNLALKNLILRLRLVLDLQQKLDPTETALAEMIKKWENLVQKIDDTSFELKQQIPFDSEYKFQTKTFWDEGREKAEKIFLGASDTLAQLADSYFRKPEIEEDLQLFQLHDLDRKNLLKNLEQVSAQGYRILGIGIEKQVDLKSLDSNNILPKKLTLLGFVALLDPIREGVQESVKMAQKSGIKVYMLTGDHPATAQSYAKQIGIWNDQKSVVTEVDLEHANPAQKANLISKNQVFARLLPQRKLEIVNFLQSQSQVVAVTGDGVNDASALKKADVGFSMGVGGSSVAKEASDMVLLDNNFNSLVKAVSLGRLSFSNLQKSVLFLLATNLAEVIVIIFISFLSPQQPLTTGQILWINLLTDSIIAISLATTKVSFKELMQDQPRKVLAPILDLKYWPVFILIASWTSLLGVFGFFLGQNDSLSKAQTMVFLAITFNQIFIMFSFLDPKRLVFKRIFSNKYLNLSSATLLFLTLCSLYFSPLTNLLQLQSLAIGEVLIFVLGGILGFVWVELLKLRRKSF